MNHASDDAIEKIRSLLRLASDPRTPKHEAEAAAHAAAKRMIAIDERTREQIFAPPKIEEPRRGNERTRATVRLSDPFVILQDVPLGLRVAKITPPCSFSSHIVFIPRAFVVSWSRLEPDEVEKIGWRRSGKIARLVVSEDYFPIAMMHGWNRWT